MSFETVTIGSCTLHNCDNMDLMRGLPDGAFDLAIVDPPYGINAPLMSGTPNDRKNGRARLNSGGGKLAGRALNTSSINWDDAIPDDVYFKELFRVSKNQIIWGANYFVEHLFQGKKGWIVWDKAQHGLTMSDCELAFSSFDFPTRIFKQNRVILLQEGTIHPTQKPIKLYEWILMNYAKEGDKILDTHLGSGSSRIAAYRNGFDFVGFEIDKDYYEAQEKRFKTELMQPRLF